MEGAAKVKTEPSGEVAPATAVRKSGTIEFTVKRGENMKNLAQLYQLYQCIGDVIHQGISEVLPNKTASSPGLYHEITVDGKLINYGSLAEWFDKPKLVVNVTQKNDKNDKSSFKRERRQYSSNDVDTKLKYSFVLRQGSAKKHYLTRGYYKGDIQVDGLEGETFGDALKKDGRFKRNLKGVRIEREDEDHKRVLINLDNPLNSSIEGNMYHVCHVPQSETEGDDPVSNDSNEKPIQKEQPTEAEQAPQGDEILQHGMSSLNVSKTIDNPCSYENMTRKGQSDATSLHAGQRDGADDKRNCPINARMGDKEILKALDELWKDKGGIQWSLLLSDDNLPRKKDDLKTKKLKDKMRKCIIEDFVLSSDPSHIPIADLPEYDILSQSVCQLTYRNGKATGWLVGHANEKAYLMTNHHVFTAFAEGKVYFTFQYLTNEHVPDAKMYHFEATAVKVYADEGLDVALIEYPGRITHDGVMLKGLGEHVDDLRTPRQKDILRLIGHPRGDPKIMDRCTVVEKPSESDILISVALREKEPYHNLPFAEDPKLVFHHSRSYQGSSGSPCFLKTDGKFYLVAMQSRGIFLEGFCEEMRTTKDSYMEVAVPLGCIIKSLMNKQVSPDLLIQLFPNSRSLFEEGMDM